MKSPLTIADLNALDRVEFVRLVGPAFEKSPWIAEAAWYRCPFAGWEHLKSTLREIVQKAGEDSKLALIRAHPDLVGRAAQAGTLTAESLNEQASAGLNQLTAAEIKSFGTLNQAYQEKFGFPFVICARLNRKAEILTAFELRLKNSRVQEIEAALSEIDKIADLRLRDLVTDN